MRPRRIHSGYPLPIVVWIALAMLIAAADLAAEEVVVPNKRSIAKVQAGRVQTAIASWWGFDPTDATKSLQAAFDSPAAKVVVPNMGRPWIVTTIELPSDKQITFEAGVVIEARRGAFLGTSDCLFVAKGRKQLRLIGNGAIFRMHKDDYHQPPYKLAEWRHALSLRGCQDILVQDLTLQDSGGDGIYLGVGAENATNRGVTIRNVVCVGNNRQGISVITAEDLLIEDCVFRDTRGTAPQAGIDFEPNRPDERIVNCVLRNCRSEDNAGHAYHFYLGHLHQDSPPISIRLENCSSKGCERNSVYLGIANRAGERTVRGTIDFAGCRFDADQAAGIYIRGNEADGCRIRFERCEIIRRDEPDSRLSPITIEAPRQPDIDVGNIEILDCTIRDSIARQPIALAASSMTRLRRLSGSLTYQTPDGTEQFRLDDKQLTSWFPRQGLIEHVSRFPFDWRQATPMEPAQQEEVKTAPNTFRVRSESTMLIWGTAETVVNFAAKVEVVGRHTPSPGVMTVAAPDGEATRLEPLADGDRATYVYTPVATGPYLLYWQGDSTTTFRVVESSAPLAHLAESRGVNFIRPVGTLYFAVPKNVVRFALQVSGSGTGETVKATVRNAADEVVGSQDNIAPPHVFSLQAAKGHEAEVWSISMEKASLGVMEDVVIQTLGIPPVFAASPDEVFVCPLAK